MSTTRMASVIRRLREQRGLTQEVLAKRAKVARGYIARLERGHSANPSLAVLRRLAKALKVKVGELLK